jgi:FdhD protein
MSGARPWPRRLWRDGREEPGAREIPEETPVALVYDASTYAVMMATPLDLVDFAVGFSLTEGVVGSPDEIDGLEIVEGELGVEARMWLGEGRRKALAARRRRQAGPTGCGLCGVDSLAEAVRPPLPVTADLHLAPDAILAAVAALAPAQALGERTRALHAAGFWTPAEGLVLVREDVGRHNALDKLAGGLARARRAGGEGVVLLTSRVSVEMVQKTAAIGASVLVAVSAPTALAARAAGAAGLTLVAVARADGFEVFTHAERIFPS